MGQNRFLENIMSPTYDQKNREDFVHFYNCLQAVGQQNKGNEERYLSGVLRK